MEHHHCKIILTAIHIFLGGAADDKFITSFKMNLCNIQNLRRYWMRNLPLQPMAHAQLSRNTRHPLRARGCKTTSDFQLALMSWDREINFS